MEWVADHLTSKDKAVQDSYVSFGARSLFLLGKFWQKVYGSLGKFGELFRYWLPFQPQLPTKDEKYQIVEPIDRNNDHKFQWAC